jgi:HupE / UreJ protein
MMPTAHSTRTRGRRWCKIIGLVAFLLTLTMRPLLAHERSESFSHWSYANGELSGVLTVRAREVTRLTLPGEGYGSLTQIFAAHVEKSVTAATGGMPCALARPPRPLESQPGYIRIGVEMRCPSGDVLQIRVGVFFDVAPTHDHFIYAESAPGAGREAILTASSRLLQLELKPSPANGARLLQFIEMGVAHIATGIDHLAFLLALLVTARNVRQVLLIVTGFTIGHSLTLTLAVIGLVQANRSAVESLIGLTIALAAACNLIRGEREGRVAALAAAAITFSVLLVPAAARPDMPATLVAAIALAAACFVWLSSTQSGGISVKMRFAMAIGFGLVHGLGFASALQDLSLPPHMLVSTLVGFNIGVEIGQLAAVALAATVLQAVGRLWPAAQRSGTPVVVMSAALLAVGTAWFLTRAVTFGN